MSLVVFAPLWAVSSLVAHPAIDARANGAELIVNEVRIHRFATPLGGMSPEARARSAASRLAAWRPGAGFATQVSRRNVLVQFGATTVATVTPAEAAAVGKTPAALAAGIRQRLSDAVALPPLRPDLTQASTALDRTVEVRLVGSQARKAVVSVRPEGVARIERALGVLRIVPLRLGTAEVVVAGSSDATSIALAVMPYALDLGRPISALVNGNPATAETVAGAARAAIQSLDGLSGAVVVRTTSLGASPLAVGGSAVARVRVRAEGAGHFPVEGVVNVAIRNAGVTLGREDDLWYSNDPENVDGPRRLYWGEMTPGRGVRLLYHHKNVTARPLVVSYLLANPSDTPAQTTILLGDAEPGLDPTKVGYEAGERFWPLWAARSAEVVLVPARTVVPLTVRLTQPDETMSGLATMMLKPGGPSRLVVLGEASSPSSAWDSWTAAYRQAGAWRAVRPRSLASISLDLGGEPAHVYPAPFRRGRIDYTVGGRFGHLRIGEFGVADAPGGRVLFGNFGVVYEIEGRIENPGETPADVELVYEASAGYGSAIFVMGDRLIRSGTLQPKESCVIATVRVPPGQRRQVSLKTMPLSGANYPGTLTVRPAGVDAGAPSIRRAVGSVVKE